ncbi:hypothetical protein HWV62_10154 [Athelia sp. TMB]|nr:hypothetical protein HWV62_10154 [Athelia sp. TMB]
MLCTNCQCSLTSSLNTSIDTIPFPVPELLTSNDPPDEQQLGSIQDAVSRARTNIQLLDDAIAPLQRRILALQAKRASLQRCVDESAAIHMRRLPIEVLEEIFMFSVPRYPTVTDYSVAPLLLGQVCRLWREVSRTTPMLWSVLRLTEPNHPELFERLVQWFERSGDCSLDLRYDLDWSEDPADRESTPAWDMVLGCSYRIEHLDAQFACDMLVPLIPSDGSHTLTRLRSLRAEQPYATGESQDYPGMYWLKERAPHLSACHMISIVPDRFALPSAQLTACTLDLVPIADFARFLLEAVNLVDCTVDITRGSARDAPFVRHTKLEKFTLNSPLRQPDQTLCIIFTCLELPSLNNLTWITRLRDPLSEDGAVEVQDDFLSFIRRSRCTLSRLCIPSGLYEDTILQLLPIVPHLVELAVAPLPRYACPHRLMRALTFAADREPLVRNLECLLLIGRSSACDCAGRYMLRAIESRFEPLGNDYPGGSQLKKLSLSSDLVASFPIRSQFREKLNRYAERGLFYTV